MHLIRAQQLERDRESATLAVVAEVDPVLEGAKSPPHAFKPKVSPKPRLFSALKKDGRARSNSSVLSIRRFSTEGILGERMDSIGRRLSRDLTNSPPDLSQKYDSFGKEKNAEGKYDTFSAASSLDQYGISKSNEGLSTGRYDTFSGKPTDRDLSNKYKKKRTKRPTITFESYHPDTSDRSHDDSYEYELPALKEGLEPPMCQEDRHKAILRQQLHKELRDKYGTRSTEEEISSADDDPGDGRPPLPRRNNDRPRRHRRQKSIDNLEVGAGSGGGSARPSPRVTRAQFKSDWTSPKRQISTERLSREDLLRISAESEIHQYLKNSVTDRPADPP